MVKSEGGQGIQSVVLLRDLVFHWLGRGRGPVLDRSTSLFTELLIDSILPVDRSFPMLLCCKEVKTQGTAKAIEGSYQAGDTMLIIDLVTTAASVLRTAVPLRAEGLGLPEATMVHAMVLAVLLNHGKVSKEKTVEVKRFIHTNRKAFCHNFLYSSCKIFPMVRLFCCYLCAFYLEILWAASFKGKLHRSHMSRIVCAAADIHRAGSRHRPEVQRPRAQAKRGPRIEYSCVCMHLSIGPKKNLKACFHTRSEERKLPWLSLRRCLDRSEGEKNVLRPAACSYSRFDLPPPRETYLVDRSARQILPPPRDASPAAPAPSLAGSPPRRRSPSRPGPRLAGRPRRQAAAPMPPKHLSGAKKRAKRKRDNQFIESQRGALNKFFQASSTSSVDVNNNNQAQEQEPETEQDDDLNSNADLEVNDKMLEEAIL